MQQAPFKSAQSVFSDPGKLIEKAHRKNGVYRILGFEAPGTIEQANTLIYEDPDTLADLARERTDTPSNGQNFIKGGFVHPYEEQRRKRKEERAMLGKRVTKDRAIKFTEHEKLVSFMSAKRYDTGLESRDALLMNLFGIKNQASANKTVPEDQLASLGHPQKRVKTASGQRDGAEDDIDLF